MQHLRVWRRWVTPGDGAEDLQRPVCASLSSLSVDACGDSIRVYIIYRSCDWVISAWILGVSVLWRAAAAALQALFHHRAVCRQVRHPTKWPRPAIFSAPYCQQSGARFVKQSMLCCVNQLMMCALSSFGVIWEGFKRWFENADEQMQMHKANALPSLSGTTTFATFWRHRWATAITAASGPFCCFRASCACGGC